MGNENYLSKTIKDHRLVGSTPSMFPIGSDPDTPLIDLLSHEMLEQYAQKTNNTLKRALSLNSGEIRKMQTSTGIFTDSEADIQLLRSKGIDTTEAETYLSQLKSKLSK